MPLCDTVTYIHKCIKVHGDKYDYSHVNYKNAHSKVKIGCKKCGRIFETRATDHLSKKYGCQCDKFRSEKLAVKMVGDILKDRHIEGEFKAANPSDVRWLEGLYLDGCYFQPERYESHTTMIPNFCLEYQGQQHYSFPNKFHKTEEEFKRQVERDVKKSKLCKDNGYELIIIPYSVNYLNESLMKHYIEQQMIERKIIF